MPAIRSPLAEFWRRFRRKWLALGAGLLLLALIAAAVAAPLIAPYDPAAPDYNAVLQAPVARPPVRHRCLRARRPQPHHLGRPDIAVDRLPVGGAGRHRRRRSSGWSAGFVGGRIDGFLMRLMDVLLAFPGIVPAIAVVAVLGPGIDNVIYAIAVFSVPVFARLVRGITLASSRPSTCRPPAASACGR